jgi:multidrug transporter EmrE-like cation transporter
MSPQGLTLVVISSLCTVAANLLMRGGIIRAGGFTLSWTLFRNQITHLCRQPMFVTGVVLYGVAAVVWFRVLSTENLSAGYPLLVSLTFILVTVGAVVFFHEQVSWQKLMGLGVILIGIVLVARA